MGQLRFGKETPELRPKEGEAQPQRYLWEDCPREQRQAVQMPRGKSMNMPLRNSEMLV